MSALSANNPSAQTNPIGYLQYKVKGSTHIYQGARCMVVSGTGYAVPCADTSGGRYIGIARNEVNNTGGDGTALVDIDPPGSQTNAIETVACASTVTIATVGVELFWVDDQTVDIAGNSTNKVSAGICVKMISSTVVQLDNRTRFTLATAA